MRQEVYKQLIFRLFKFNFLKMKERLSIRLGALCFPVMLDPLYFSLYLVSQRHEDVRINECINAMYMKHVSLWAIS